MGMDRICAKCGKRKPLSKFIKDRTKPLGRSRSCRQCENARLAEYKRRQRGALRWMERTERKTCSYCRKELPLNRFFRDKAAADGYRSQCKACQTTLNKIRRRLVKERKISQVEVGRWYRCRGVVYEVVSRVREDKNCRIGIRPISTRGPLRWVAIGDFVTKFTEEPLES